MFVERRADFQQTEYSAEIGAVLFIDKDTKFIDLFAGIGGFHIAVGSTGAQCVFSSDIDKYASMTYEHNFHVNPLNDITVTEASDIPDFDVLCGGFPCQSWSISGKQLGFEDARGTLFYDILRIANYHHPKLMFLENVYNLERHDNGKTFIYMRECLNKAGYAVYHKVLCSSDYGVPQARRRIYIICVRDDIKLKDGDTFKFPEPTYADIVLNDVLSPADEVRQFIINRKDIKFDMSMDEIKSIERTLAPVRIGSVGNGGQGNRIYSPNGHAITLSAYGGGAGSKTGLYLVDDVVRKLSPNECLRVQGFPSWYEFPETVSNQQRWKQTGNSVSVPVLEKIVDAINNQIG